MENSDKLSLIPVYLHIYIYILGEGQPKGWGTFDWPVL